MRTIAWIFIKSFFSKALDVFMRYPLQIILVLVCIYAFWQKTRYDAIVSDYAAYKSAISIMETTQKAKNEMLRKQAETALNDVIAVHKDYLTTEKLDRKRVEDKLKGSINEISNELNIYRDSIRLRNSTTNSVRVPTLAEDPIRSASTSGNCNQTLATVIDACKVTDYDYEALYNLYQKQCNIYGCE